MAVGDPHLKTLVSNKEFQTCSGLEYFDKYITEGEERMMKKRQALTAKEEVFAEIAEENQQEYMRSAGLLARDKIVLVSNEWFKVEGTLARWSSDTDGTFFKDVSVQESIYLKYMSNDILTL